MKPIINNKKLCGWGRYPKTDCNISSPSNRNEISKLIEDSQSLIARGNGRSYGDAAFNTNLTLHTKKIK